jgi:tetratricopeptide (TPR) repeat protein
MAGIMAKRKLLAEALQIDPKFGPAAMGYVDTLADEWYENPTADQDQLAREMDAVSSRAIAVAGSQYQSWRARARALEHLGRWDEALVANDRILSLDPDNEASLNERALVFQFSGRPGEALKSAERALMIDPQSGDAYHYLCKAHLYLGEYAAAESACEKAAALNNHWWIQYYLVAIYTRKGETGKAKLAKEQLLRKQPGFTQARYRAMLRPSPPAYFERFDQYVAPYLTQAGIPVN